MRFTDFEDDFIFSRSIYLLNQFPEDKQLLIEEDVPSHSLAGQPLRTGLD